MTAHPILIPWLGAFFSRFLMVMEHTTGCPQLAEQVWPDAHDPEPELRQTRREDGEAGPAVTSPRRSRWIQPHPLARLVRSTAGNVARQLRQPELPDCPQELIPECYPGGGIPAFYYSQANGPILFPWCSVWTGAVQSGYPGCLPGPRCTQGCPCTWDLFLCSLSWPKDSFVYWRFMEGVVFSPGSSIHRQALWYED